MDIHLAWIISFSLKFTTSLVPTGGTFFFLSSNPTGNRQMNRKIHLETLKDIIERAEKKGKKKTIHEQFLHQLEKYPIIPNVNIIGFFFCENHLFPLRFPPKTLSSVEHVRYYSIWKRRLIKDGYVLSNLISLGNAYLPPRRFRHF